LIELSRSRLKLERGNLAEERVNLAIDITDVCVRVCADAVRDRYPAAKEEEILERVRERIVYGRRREREV